MRFTALLLIVVLSIVATKTIAHPSGEDLAVTVFGVTSPAPVGQQQRLNVTWKNFGSSRSSPSILVVTIRDASKRIIHEDTLPQVPIEAGASVQPTSLLTVPMSPGTYSVVARISAPNDPNSANDTLSAALTVVPRVDGKADQILVPKRDTEIAYHAIWTPRARFISNTEADAPNVRVRVYIFDSIKRLLFRADTVIANLPANAVPIDISFPPHQKVYDLTTLQPGTYDCVTTISIPFDANPSNDTTYSRFSIVANKDIRLLSITPPIAGLRVRKDTTLQISATASNTGATTLNVVKMLVRVINLEHNLMYTDSQTVLTWPKSSVQHFAFKPLVLKDSGSFQVTICASASSDDYRLNDTLRSYISTRSLPDFTCALQSPPNGSRFAVNQIPPPSVVIRNQSISAETYIGVQAQILDQYDRILFTGEREKLGALWGSNEPFTFRQLAASLSHLGIGTYKIRILAASDAMDLAPIDSLSFSIVPKFSLALDTILSPRDSTNVDSAFTLSVRTRNKGLTRVTFKYIICYFQDNRQVRVDTLFGTVNAADTITSTLSNVHLSGTGYYRATVQLLADSNETPERTTATLFLYFGSPLRDVAAWRVTYPSQDQEIDDPFDFSPTIDFSWRGGFISSFRVTLTCEVRPCGTDSIVYQYDTAFTGNPSQTGGWWLDCPSFNTLYPGTPIPEGCYSIRAYARSTEDQNSLNDTIESSFYYGSSSVQAEALLNPWTHIKHVSGRPILVVTSEQPAKLTFHIFDITGKCMMSTVNPRPIVSGETEISLADLGLASGEYWIEQILESSGRVDQHAVQKFVLIR